MTQVPYPKFPELDSGRINLLIITTKYLTVYTKVWNQLPFWLLIREFWYIPPPPFLINYLYLETLFHFSWSSIFLSEISWFQEIFWKVASLHAESTTKPTENCPEWHVPMPQHPVAKYYHAHHHWQCALGTPNTLIF